MLRLYCNPCVAVTEEEWLSGRDISGIVSGYRSARRVRPRAGHDIHGRVSR